MTRQRLKDLASLARTRGRRAHGLFLVEGVRSVVSAIGAGAPLVEVVVSHEAATGEPLAAALGAFDGPVHTVPAADVARVGDARTSQGVVAVSRRIVHEELGGDARRVLLLDGVQDPGNVGTLVRTAAWLGVDAVVGDQKTADFESPKAVRAAMGGLWDVRLVRVPDLGPVVEMLSGAGVAVWGADLDGVALSDWRPAPGPSALVLGSEAHGISDGVRQRLAGTVSIPGGGAGRGVESLNVVVAGGILMNVWAGGQT